MYYEHDVGIIKDLRLHLKNMGDTEHPSPSQQIVFT